MQENIKIENIDTNGNKEQQPLFLNLSRTEQKAAIEALIFSSDEPLSAPFLFKLLISGGLSDYQILQTGNGNRLDSSQNMESELADKHSWANDLIPEIIKEINKELTETNRPFQIVEFAGGYSYSTKPEWGALTGQLAKSKTKRRLSQASLETLAIIAYRQPVSKPEIEQIRGVNSGDIVNSLIEKNLVRIAGRKDTLGKPLLYGTTDDFLKMFGLRSLEELPKLRELEDLGINEPLPENQDEDAVESVELTN